MSDISRERISRIERIEVHSPRPRDVGCNARSGAHGTVVQDRWCACTPRAVRSA